MNNINTTKQNELAWDKKVENKSPWSIPVNIEKLLKAKENILEITLTATKVVPRHWFPQNLKNLNILCLACGGGQQGPVLAALWSKNAKSKKGDMSIFKKTAIGMMLLGLAFIVMSTAEIVRGDGQANLMWIVVVGILISLGEMVFAPLGKSFISKFSPAKLLGLMMGVWPLARFIAGKTYGYLFEMLSQYSFAYAYGIVAIIVILCGLIIWKLDKKMTY